MAAEKDQYCSQNYSFIVSKTEFRVIHTTIYHILNALHVHIVIKQDITHIKNHEHVSHLDAKPLRFPILFIASIDIL